MKEPGLTQNIKLNFLIVLSNVLITKKTNSYVEKQLLIFDDHLDSLSDYNWAEYLLNSLVAAVQSWNRSTSVFFNNSLIFLTLLYVDRVRHKGIKLVERLTPFYKGGPKKSSERDKRLSYIMGSLELDPFCLH
ncbi:hypothetical protein POM88_022345 [Heracleum sosnowskyi]|uniref:Uncharacterized protein n=1 Tax=Heracleum sosnowskyi TaxID=360622 RepID=A0AAD8IIP3_9APIA|nr:hypothetical protein POM88_022345 [Heracleum sosnowskyi]